MKLQLDPALGECTVLFAANNRVLPGFDSERAVLYDIKDPVDRDRAFATLFHKWFRSLDLNRHIEAAFAEQPSITEGVSLASVIRAKRARDEGVELFVREGGSDPDDRRMQVRLRPATLCDDERLIPLLRTELQHVADMLDPTFGYEPELPPSPAGPTHDKLLVDRYGTAWHVSACGRLARRGLLSDSTKARAKARFQATFRFLGSDAEEVFEEIFSDENATHLALLSFAQRPARRKEQQDRCTLCAMPSYAFEPPHLVEHVAAKITADFPEWTPEEAVCPQCTDLYRARAS